MLKNFNGEQNILWCKILQQVKKILYLYYDSENPNFLKLKETGVQIGMLFDALFTLSPVMYFNEECYEKLIKVPKEELLKRLEGKAKKVLILEKGIYIIFNDKADISYDEFVEMNETFKPLLGLI